MSQQRENLVYFTCFLCKNASQTAKIVNVVYGPHIVTVQFWFHWLHSGIFEAKDTSQTDKISLKISVKSQK